MGLLLSEDAKEEGLIPSQDLFSINDMILLPTYTQHHGLVFHIIRLGNGLTVLRLPAIHRLGQLRITATLVQNILDIMDIVFLSIVRFIHDFRIVMKMLSNKREPVSVLNFNFFQQLFDFGLLPDLIFLMPLLFNIIDFIEERRGRNIRVVMKFVIKVIIDPCIPKLVNFLDHLGFQLSLGYHQTSGSSFSSLNETWRLFFRLALLITHHLQEFQLPFVNFFIRLDLVKIHILLIIFVPKGIKNAFLNSVIFFLVSL